MKIKNLDHLVLTVKDLDASIKFYTEVLGLKKIIFGNQKINLHELFNEFEPKAINPTPGSSDLCFITEGKLELVIDHLRRSGIEIIEGPIKRTGANGIINSIYVRDPDENLIELSNY